jgi:hypothetical protein
VATAYLGPQTDRAVLVDFYKKVRPFGPGWREVREAAGLGEDPGRTTGDNIPLALLGWVAGCATIWSSLFTVGNFLYGRTGPALACLAVFVVAGLVLVRVIGRLWQAPQATA